MTFDSYRIRTASFLALIFVGYAACIVHLRPRYFFGLSEDDAIYFSSAKALAAGQGYVLPSLPGSPPATKYPILYPSILSWVWKWNPNFPSNLADAAGISIAFGCAFIAGAFAFFKEVGRLGDAESLFLSVLCGVHPLVFLYGVNLVAEIPFAAMVLWALVLAGKTTKPRADVITVILCGVLAGCLILTRILGVPVAAGIYLAVLYRKGWRRSLTFAGTVAPFLAAVIWRSIVSAPVHAPLLAAGNCAESWKFSWMYHTNYLSLWYASAIQSHAKWNMIRDNLLVLAVQPGMYFLDFQLLKHPEPIIIGGLLLSVTVWRGWIFHARGQVQPIHLVLAIYLIPVILWVYPNVSRFLIPFLPFVVLGLWLEIKRLSVPIRLAFTKSSPANQKAAAVFLCALAVALGLVVGRSYELGTATTMEWSKKRGIILNEKLSAYGWLRANTEDNAIVIAYEDASLFLYTGRQSFRPVIFSPAVVSRPEQLRTDLDCITASGQALNAGYWLIAEDDFGLEPKDVAQLARAREKQFESVLPVVFSSSNGNVRIVRRK
jgi:hypothetical protein